MPYVGGELKSLFSPDLARDAARAMAAALGDRAHSVVAEFSPVKTGNLRTSWYRDPPASANRVRRPEGTGYRVRVATDVSYAGYVEEGTGIWGPRGAKYPIVAKPGHWLSWISTRPFTDKSGKVHPAGTRVFAKRVMHPGIKGQHMMGRTALTVEVGLDQIVDPVLRAWARAQEREAD